MTATQTPTSSNGHAPAPAARRNSRRPALPPVFRRIFLYAFLIVTVPGAGVSLGHAYETITHAGLAWYWALPIALTVDALVVGCSVTMMAARRLGERSHWTAKVGVVLGGAGAVGANVAAVKPEIVSVDDLRLLIGLWIPVVVAIMAHLGLHTYVEQEADPEPAPARRPAPAPTAPVPPRPPAVTQRPTAPAQQAPRPAVTAPAAPPALPAGIDAQDVPPPPEGVDEVVWVIGVSLYRQNPRLGRPTLIENVRAAGGQVGTNPAREVLELLRTHPALNAPDQPERTQP